MTVQENGEAGGLALPHTHHQLGVALYRSDQFHIRVNTLEHGRLRCGSGCFAWHHDVFDGSAMQPVYNTLAGKMTYCQRSMPVFNFAARSSSVRPSSSRPAFMRVWPRR